MFSVVYVVLQTVGLVGLGNVVEEGVDAKGWRAWMRLRERVGKGGWRNLDQRRVGISEGIAGIVGGDS